MNVADKMTEAQDRVIDGVTTAQTRMIEMNRQAAQAVTGLMPKSERFDAISMPSIPGMNELPAPEVVIDRYFDFATKMAEANRSFYKEMVSAWTPAQPTEKAAPKKSSKSTAKKGRQKTATKASK